MINFNEKPGFFRDVTARIHEFGSHIFRKFWQIFRFSIRTELPG